MKNRISTALFGLVLFLTNPFSIAAQAILDNAQAQNVPTQSTPAQLAPAQEAPAPEPPVAQDAPLAASETPLLAQANVPENFDLRNDVPQIEAPRFASPSAPVNSLAALDAEAANFAALVGQTLAALPPNARVRVGSFHLDGEHSLFETYWTNQLSSNLSNLENRSFLITTGNRREADYTLNGVIVCIGDTLRVYTRLIRVQDAALMLTWLSDYAITPFIQSLLPDYVAFSISPASPGLTILWDEYEPDSMDTPLFIEIGDPWLERTLHEGDEDWFVLVAELDSVLVFETRGGVYRYMELYDAETGLRLAEDDAIFARALYELDLLLGDDGSREDFNVRIEYEAEAGKIYIVKVWGYDYETGVYQFRASIEETPSDTAFEPNNSLEEATLIEVGERVSGYFQSSSDVDWYRINAEAGTYLTIYTEGSMDTFITAYDQAGNELGSDDDSGSRLNARLRVNVPSDGVVYAEVSEYDWERGSYTLGTELMVAGESDAYEPDNNPPDAKEIRPGETQNRTFTIAEDADYVRFTISEKGLYEIRTIAAGNYLDSYIGLYHGDVYRYIAEDDDSGDNYDACLRVELEAGEYLLEIYCWDDDPLSNSAYTLSLTLVTEDDSD